MHDRPDDVLETHALELLDRYFLNNLPPDERDALRVALAQAGFDLDDVERMRQLWETPREIRTPMQPWLQQLHGRLGLGDAPRYGLPTTAAVQRTPRHTPTRVPVRAPTRAGWMPRMAWMGAASVAVAIAMGAGAWMLVRQHAAPASQVATYTTGNAEHAKVRLPDGTVVTLNVASRLDVPADYGEHRTLRLSGQALFDVTHHATVPFVVVSGRNTTRVLGTSFTVRHYATDTAVIIAVRDGKVAVGATIVAADQQVTVGARGASAVRAVDAAQFSFEHGVLTLRDVPLADAIPDLNRWYNADLRLGDPALAPQKVVGGFRAGSLGDLKAFLELAFHVRVVQSGRVLTLYPKG